MRFARLLKMLLIAGAALFLAACVLSYWLLFEADVQSSSYSSYKDAEAGDLFQRGWLPPFIPTTSSAIQEIHDLDTNQRCASFVVPSEDASAFLNSLQDFGFLKLSIPAESPAALSPWRRCPFPQPVTEARTVLRRPDADSAEVEYFAFYENPSLVYYWSALR
jgi:hypothetical protein